ncbi:MAG: DUF507 family protein [Polyangiaceae bacterium]|nr:DUF507 family protein [Polyangiaceae bacterium]
MRLFSGKVTPIAQEAVRALLAAKAIETEAPREVEADVASVLQSYLRTEQEAADAAKDHLARTGKGQTEFTRLKRLYAEQKGIKVGDELLDHLLDQVVELLLQTGSVDEVFAEDHELRRLMAPSFKKHMVIEDDLDREARGRLKHVTEGTSAWEIEYQKVMADMRRKKGLG